MQSIQFFLVDEKWCRVRDALHSNFIIEKKHHQSLPYFFLFFFLVISSFRHITYHAGVIDGDRHLFTQRFRSSVFGLRSSVFSYSRNCRLRHGGRPVAGSSCGTRYTRSPSSQGRGAHTRTRFRRQDRRHSVRTCQT